ncbi:hypothetical protein GS448_26125 [Rhodococcus hoagii]|nr:hypothetical protein [Prescottella equi]
MRAWRGRPAVGRCTACRPRVRTECPTDRRARGALRRPRAGDPAAGPLPLLGWSLGGNIAHEMAVRLQDIGEDVASLTILDAMPATAVLDAAHPTPRRSRSCRTGWTRGPPSECCAPARPSRRWRTATDPAYSTAM